MKFTDNGHNARYIRRISVADGPVHPMAYSQTGKVFRVDHVEIRYTLDPESGHWDWNSRSDINLTGPVLKKDGSDSRNFHTRHPGCKYNPYRLAEDYAWVGKLIEDARPIGEVHLPEVN